MNFKTTLILLVLFVAAATYVIVDRFYSNRKDQDATDPTKLFDLKKPRDVTSLLIRSNDGSEIVLSKDDKDTWKMTKPVSAPADSAQVETIVNGLLRLESRGQVDTAGKGLDKPRFHIEVSAKGGKLLKFDVGDKNQLGDNMYVRIEGRKKADVVAADVYDQLSKPANDLRDKQLFQGLAATDVRQLVVEAGGQRLHLQKAASKWELVEPVKLPGDETVVTDMLGAITGMRATDWIANDSSEVSRAQFDKPQMVVSFTTAAPSTRPAAAPATQPKWTSITFGRFDNIREEKIYAKMSDTGAIVKVTSHPFTTLNKKPLDIRDKELLSIDPTQVSKLAIVSDIPASVSPPRPERKTTVSIERRKQVDQNKPASTQAASRPATQVASATTKASTRPATAPATQPVSTQPALPPSPWVLVSDPKGDADEEGVKSLLGELHPLRVTKYVESLPTTRPSGSYTLKLTTEGPGGTPVTNYEMTLVDPGNDQPLLGSYNGISFEAARGILSKMEGNFARKPPGSENKAPKPDAFEFPGQK